MAHWKWCRSSLPSALALGDTEGLLKRHHRILLGASFLVAAVSPFIPGGWNYVLSLLPLTVMTIIIGQGRWLAFRWLEPIGDLSYGIYLTAWPVQSIAIVNLGGSINVWGISALTALITGTYAFFSWRLVEKPALNLKKHIPARRAR